MLLRPFNDFLEFQVEEGSRIFRAFFFSFPYEGEVSVSSHSGNRATYITLFHKKVTKVHNVLGGHIIHG